MSVFAVVQKDLNNALPGLIYQKKSSAYEIKLSILIRDYPTLSERAQIIITRIFKIEGQGHGDLIQIPGAS